MHIFFFPLKKKKLLIHSFSLLRWDKIETSEKKKKLSHISNLKSLPWKKKTKKQIYYEVTSPNASPITTWLCFALVTVLP